MEQKITKELLQFLLAEGYTYLVAENQATRDIYVFLPVDWDEDAFNADLMYYSYDDHMIISVKDALLYWQVEDYLTHTIIMPKY